MCALIETLWYTYHNYIYEKHIKRREENFIFFNPNSLLSLIEHKLAPTKELKEAEGVEDEGERGTKGATSGHQLA